MFFKKEVKIHILFRQVTFQYVKLFIILNKCTQIYIQKKVLNLRGGWCRDAVVHNIPALEKTTSTKYSDQQNCTFREKKLTFNTEISILMSTVHLKCLSLREYLPVGLMELVPTPCVAVSEAAAGTDGACLPFTQLRSSSSLLWAGQTHPSHLLPSA